MLTTKKLASMVALLACRGDVRAFVAAGGWRSSLACLLGALSAAPGSVAMLAHRRIAFCAVLARWRFRFQAGLEFFPFAYVCIMSNVGEANIWWSNFVIRIK